MVPSKHPIQNARRTFAKLLQRNLKGSMCGMNKIIYKTVVIPGI